VRGKTFKKQRRKIEDATASNEACLCQLVELVERVTLLAAASVAEELVLLHVLSSLSCNLIQPFGNYS
jgi:hypothetical protein